MILNDTNIAVQKLQINKKRKCKSEDAVLMCSNQGTQKWFISMDSA